ncbi:MAG: hypothetical protein IJI97_06720 [Clostridia bacterium]|nr:hypothetical protein [Clostridia bacterium]
MPCDDCSRAENCPPCVNSDEAVIKAQVRDDVICPKSPVRGGGHRMSHMGTCLVCGHRSVFTDLSMIIDLLQTIDTLRSDIAHIRDVTDISG